MSVVECRCALASMGRSYAQLGLGVRSSKATAARLTSFMRQATSVSFSPSTLAMTSFSDSILLCTSSNRSLVLKRQRSVRSLATDRSQMRYWRLAQLICRSFTSLLSCSISRELSSFFLASTLQSSSWAETVSLRWWTLRSRDRTYSAFAIFLYFSTSSLREWHSALSLSISLLAYFSLKSIIPLSSSMRPSFCCSHSPFVLSTALMALRQDTPSLSLYLTLSSGSLRKRKSLRRRCSWANTSLKLLSTSEKLLRTKQAARMSSSLVYVFCCAMFQKRFMLKPSSF